jgi:hypothetical protein
LSRELIHFVALDALANDLEDLEGILRILNSPSELGWRDQHPAEFTRDEVVPALLRAIGDGTVEACVYSDSERALVGVGENVVPNGPFDHMWFRLTRRGRMVLDAWKPPPLPGGA